MNMSVKKRRLVIIGAAAATIGAVGGEVFVVVAADAIVTGVTDRVSGKLDRKAALSTGEAVGAALAVSGVQRADHRRCHGAHPHTPQSELSGDFGCTCWAF